MESLVLKLVRELGPKWVALCSRLELDHRARHRFLTEHMKETKEEKEINCAHDTIRMWRNLKEVSALPEQEAMTRLLFHLRKVPGFRERAQELAESYGLSLPPVKSSPGKEAPSSSSPSASNTHGIHAIRMQDPLSKKSPQNISNSSADTNTKPSTPVGILPKNTIHTPSQITPHHPPQSTPHSSQTEGKVSLRQISIDADSNIHVLRQLEEDSRSDSGQNQQNTLPQPPALSQQCTAHNHTLLHSPIDLGDTTQKFAILDISQRLPPTSLREITRRLKVPKDAVQCILSENSREEERYYQVFRWWLESGGAGKGRGGEKGEHVGSGGEMTFAHLRAVLEGCQQSAVCRVMLRRLSGHRTDTVVTVAS